MDNSHQEFLAYYDQYSDKIYQFVFYRTLHKEIAEDITSQIFMKALQKFDTFDADKGTFSAWIYQIARNTIIDAHRTRKDFLDLESAEEPHIHERSEERFDASFKLDQIQKYMRGFSEDQRAVVLMRVWDGLSFKDIAEILGKSEASCKMSFSRSIAKIRSEFGAIALFILFLSNFFINR